VPDDQRQKKEVHQRSDGERDQPEIEQRGQRPLPSEGILAP
jgi:hypothetical protein